MNAKLATFVRALGRVEEPHAETATTELTKTDPGVMRFRTLGGAVVSVTYSGGLYDVCCDGCDWTHPDYSAKRYARDEANAHAGECRSMPKPTA